MSNRRIRKRHDALHGSGSHHVLQRIPVSRGHRGRDSALSQRARINHQPSPRAGCVRPRTGPLLSQQRSCTAAYASPSCSLRLLTSQSWPPHIVPSHRRVGHFAVLTGRLPSAGSPVYTSRGSKLSTHASAKGPGARAKATATAGGETQTASASGDDTPVEPAEEEPTVEPEEEDDEDEDLPTLPDDGADSGFNDEFAPAGPATEAEDEPTVVVSGDEDPDVDAEVAIVPTGGTVTPDTPSSGFRADRDTVPVPSDEDEDPVPSDDDEDPVPSDEDEDPVPSDEEDPEPAAEAEPALPPAPPRAPRSSGTAMDRDSVPVPNASVFPRFGGRRLMM